MSRTIVVTGSYGFIGRNTSISLANRRWNVIGIGHGNWSPSEWRGMGLSDYHACDVTIDSLRKYISNPFAIIHCAGSGSVGYSVTNPAEDFERTVDTTSQVVEFVRQYSPNTRIIYPSSAAVYGHTENIPIKESEDLNPISPYGLHKRMAEDILRLYSSNFGLKCVIVRLFSVYGNGLRKQLFWDACNKVIVGDFDFGGSGDEIRDWIHVSDVAKLFELAFDHASTECLIVNGASGVGVKIRDVLVKIFDDLSSSNEPAFSKKSRMGDPDIYVADIQRIRDWGWELEKDLSVGIKEYVDWFRESAET